MLITAGARDQTPVRATPDYGLIYTGEELGGELTIAGPVDVVLQVESDCPDTDFVAKLIELHPDGRAILLMDGVTRAMYRGGSSEPLPLAPGEVVEVGIHLGHIHHTFSPGSRIEIDVTSSNFPRRARNTNSGHRVLADDTVDDIRVATNTVHHDAGRPSFVVLTVIDGDDGDGSTG